MKFSFAQIKAFFKKTREVPALESEIVTRFVIENSKCSPGKKKLHHSAFMPSNNQKNSDISVYCIFDILDEPHSIWNLAIKHFNPNTKARGDLIVKEINKIENETQYLSVLINGIPHKKHANIKNLPDKLEKAKLKVIALQLADLSRLDIR